MAVDIKTLRIGSHVEYDGKRVRVALVRDDGCICEYKDNGQDVIVGLGIEKQPIPITPELLAELGFVNTSSSRRITYTKGSEYEDLWIEVRNLKDRWEVFVSDNNWDGRIVCRYLHEAELFLVLHNIELVKD